MRKKLGASAGLVLVSAIAAAMFVSSSTGAVTGPAVRIAPFVKDTGTGGNHQTFMNRTIVINYTGGGVVLSGNPAGTGNLKSDDVAQLTVTHADHSTSSWSYDFSNNCLSPISPIGPVDISSLLATGVNTLHFTEADQCGSGFGGTGYWITLP